MEPSAAISALETCFKYGALIVEKCSNWKHANEELAERITNVELSWVQTRVQVRFIGRIQDDLDDEHQRVLDDTIAVLAAKLTLAVAKIDGLLSRDDGAGSLTGRARRVRYALQKDTLDEIIADLEAWKRRFDPSWFLIMRLASPLVDDHLRVVGREEAKTPEASTATIPISRAADIRRTLQHQTSQQQPHKSVFLPPDPHMVMTEIDYSNAAVASRLHSTGSNNSKTSEARRFIVDPLPLRSGADPAAFEADVRELVHRLSRADPKAFSLLRSKGAIRIREPPPSTVPGSRSDNTAISRYDLILNAPASLGPAPLSMRAALLGENGKPGLPLSQRVRLAQQLARSVADVHAFGFVHKNIRPESVLVAPDAAFLVGFGAFRSVEGATMQAGDVALERELYRHPSRQGEQPGQKYVMQHDIYSLGVVLLEVGLGESFLEYQTSAALPDDESPVGRGKELNRTAIACTRSAMQGLLGWSLKKYFVRLAGSTLAHVFGDRYAAVVINCLTCLDVDNADFGDADEFKDDADETRVGVRFIEKILESLNQILV